LNVLSVSFYLNVTAAAGTSPTTTVQQDSIMHCHLAEPSRAQRLTSTHHIKPSQGLGKDTGVPFARQQIYARATSMSRTVFKTHHQTLKGCLASTLHLFKTNQQQRQALILAQGAGHLANTSCT
jgi:hypothetical protein